MKNNGNCSPRLKDKALSTLVRIQGTKGLSLAHHFRARGDLFNSPKYVIRSLSTKRSNYKSIPLHKLIALPPEYTLGSRKRITPIRGSHDKSLVFKSHAGFLVIPKKTLPVSFSSATPSPTRPTIPLKQAHKIITSHIKELKNKLYPKSTRLPLVSSRVFSDSQDIKNSNEYSEKSMKLHRIRSNLLKKWNSFFSNI